MRHNYGYLPQRFPAAAVWFEMLETLAVGVPISKHIGNGMMERAEAFTMRSFSGVLSQFVGSYHRTK